MTSCSGSPNDSNETDDIGIDDIIHGVSKLGDIIDISDIDSNHDIDGANDPGDPNDSDYELPCWVSTMKEKNVDLDIFLPTGIVIPLIHWPTNHTLVQIKDEVWRVGLDYPLFELMQPKFKYVFQSVTSKGEKAEFTDETKKLCDLNIFHPHLQLIELNVSIDAKLEEEVNTGISIALGCPLDQLDGIDVEEVIEFRRNSVNFSKGIVYRRDQVVESLGMYTYCAKLGKQINASHREYKYFAHGHEVKVWITPTEFATVKVDKEANADTIIEEIFRNPPEHWQCNTLLSRSEYVLKLCAVQEYLLGSYPLRIYEYIQSCARRGKIPQLKFVEKKHLYSLLPVEPFLIPSYYRREYRTSEGEVTDADLWINLWNIETTVSVYVLCATFIDASDDVCVKSAIFHGDVQISSTQETAWVPHDSPKWNEYLKFELSVKDLPRCARLCISLCSVPCDKKQQDEVRVIAWGNVNLFDFRGKLIAGKFELDLIRAPTSENTTSIFYPLGVPVMKSANLEVASLKLKFNLGIGPVQYPRLQDMLHIAKKADSASGVKLQASVNTTEEAYLKDLISRDALCQLSDQDKELIWQCRKYCCWNLPNALPFVVRAVDWSSVVQTAQFYQILQDWLPINLETALILLDCKCVDLYVREFATKNIEHTLQDSEISDLLLQLVQSLKYEPYIESALGMFLLRKALTNRTIGNYFMWHVRSQINVKFSSWIDLRFTLLLETYCRGLCGHLKEVIKQVDAIERLSLFALSLNESSAGDEYGIELITKQEEFLKALDNMKNPVCPNVDLGCLNVERCKILSSAKKPLWLEWKNKDPIASCIGPDGTAVIFKIGDDLRQDMLTLQVIRTMDELWRDHGLDLNLVTYNCVATGKDVGFIQAVPKSLTVFKIQRNAGTLAAIQVNSETLHEFLRHKNTNEAEYSRAIENFTKSCAGYCVVTFILGIGDRHPDNIMLTECGNIFHIDFGHFLGHFKSKFGISRERVPFVLTDDFITVIAKGAADPQKSSEFQEFQQLCGRAYLILRRHANLLIGLFTLMLYSGIPDLTGDDIEHLRTTLAVDKTEEDALDFFQTRFSEAHGGGWTTKLDWFFHSLKHM